MERAVEKMNREIAEFLALSSRTAQDISEISQKADETAEELEGLRGEYENHAQGDADRHTAADVDYSPTRTVAGEIEALRAELSQDTGAVMSVYRAHAQGTSDRHTAADVDYSPSHTVKEKIDALIIDGGGGTMYHDELLNRGTANAHPASAITGLGEVLTFTAQSDGLELAFPLCDTESPFITRDHFGSYLTDFITLPSGAAFIEVKAVCYPEEASDAEECARGFSAEGVLALDGEGNYFLYSTDTLYKDAEADPESNPEFVFNVSDTKGAYIRFKGVNDVKINWRATVRIAPWEEGADVEAV